MKAKVLGWLAGLMPIAVQAADLPAAPQVLGVFERAGNGPTALIDGFGALGFDVHVVDQTWPGGNPPGAGDYALVLDLWADQQPYASVLCLGAGQQAQDQVAAQAGDGADAFASAGRQPYGTATDRRVYCDYSLWNPESDLTPFMAAAADWAAQQIGPLLPTDHPYFASSASAVNLNLIGSGRIWAVQLILISGGDEASLQMRVLLDVPELPG